RRDGGDGGRDTLVVDAHPSGRGSEDIGAGDKARCGDGGDAPEEQDSRSDEVRGVGDFSDEGCVEVNPHELYPISNDRRIPLRRGQLTAQDPIYGG
ncbi:hypothetical protein CTA1_10414, partial [Colletotrichum tanaceti]